MCTLCLSDMGELRDEWLREPRPTPLIEATARLPDATPVVPRANALFLPAREAAAA